MTDELVSFLRDLMRRRRRLPSQLAADLGISHATVIRWLSGASLPGIDSCRKLAEYSGVSVLKVLQVKGSLPSVPEMKPDEWPEFREYAQRKYPEELDEDIIYTIEGLIEKRRARRLKKVQAVR